MKKALFEVATLADAVSKANRVAPTKGSALDRAAGIVLCVDPFHPDSNESVIVMSTDLEVTFRQSITSLELGDEAVTWRVPSTLFSGVMNTLPMTTGSTVTLRDNGDGNLYIISGKTKARLRLLVGEPPRIERYDPDTLGVVPGFARRLAQVAWAADTGASHTPLSGVHLDGDRLWACNRQVLAVVPCKVPVDRPVTAPLAGLSSIIKNTSEVNLAAGDHHLQIMPDAYTQTSSVIHMQDYPDVRKIERTDFTGEFTVDTAALQAALTRMSVLVKSERLPSTTLEVSAGTARLVMDAPEVGKIADEVDIDGGSDFTIHFTPENLAGALTASGAARVTIAYGPTQHHSLRITDTDNFTAYVMPRRQ